MAISFRAATATSAININVEGISQHFDIILPFTGSCTMTCNPQNYRIPCISFYRHLRKFRCYFPKVERCFLLNNMPERPVDIGHWSVCGCPVIEVSFLDVAIASSVYRRLVQLHYVYLTLTSQIL